MTAAGRPAGRAPVGDALVVAIAVAVVAATLLAVAVTGARPSSDLATRAHDVAASLRCPVCQDLSAADSPSPMAAQMRRQIVDDLRRGRSPEQIRTSFVRAYGDTVLMAPPRHGLGSLAYLLPLIVLGAAASTGVLLLRRWLRRPRSHVGTAVPAQVKEVAG